MMQEDKKTGPLSDDVYFEIEAPLTPELLKRLHLTLQEMLDEVVRICEENGLRYYLHFGTLLGAVRHKGPIPWDDDLDIVMPRSDYEVLKALLLARSGDELYHIHCFENDKAMCRPFMRIRKRGTIYRRESDSRVGMRDVGAWLDICPFDDIPQSSGVRCHLYIKLVSLLMRLISNKAQLDMRGGRAYAKVVHLLLRPFSRERLHDLLERLIRHWDGTNCDYYVFWNTPYNIEDEIMPKAWYEQTAEMEYGGKKYKVPKEWDKVLTQLYGDYMTLPPVEKRKPHGGVEIKL